MNAGTIHPPCKKCSPRCLDTTFTGEDLHANDPVSKDYPTDYPTGDGIDPQTEGRTCNLKMLFPMKLNTDWMLQAVRSTYCGTYRGSWSNAQAGEYLKTYNVKSSTVELMIEIADSNKAECIFNPDNTEPQF